MSAFLLACRFVGAWLLVAGPTYQAGLELDAEELEFHRIHRLIQEVAPPPVSPLWWLLPPVKLVLNRIQFNQHRNRLMERLSSADLAAMWRFSNKATGWLLVAGGGLLLAMNETRELTQLFSWSHWAYAALCAGLSILCVANTLFRLKQTRRLLAKKAALQPAQAE